MPTAVKKFKYGKPVSDEFQPRKDVFLEYEPDDGSLAKKDMESIQESGAQDRVSIVTGRLI